MEDKDLTTENTGGEREDFLKNINHRGHREPQRERTKRLKNRKKLTTESTEDTEDERHSFKTDLKINHREHRGHREIKK